MTTRKEMQDSFLSVALLDASSPPDGAIFFSGPRAKRAAKQAVTRSDGKLQTVLDTEALSEFNKWQPLYFGKDAKFSIAEAYFIGDCISESFARNASGAVTIYLDGIKPHGTFARAELPTLLQNPNVEKFIVHDYGTVDMRSAQAPTPVEMDKQKLAQYIQNRIDGVPDRRLSVGRAPGGAAPQPTIN